MCEPFTEVDKRAINTIRVVACDMINKANSGHPGAPMGCAPMAHVLFSRFLKCNPNNSQWVNIIFICTILNNETKKKKKKKKKK